MAFLLALFYLKKIVQKLKKLEKLEKNSIFNFKNKMRFCIILLVVMLLSVLLYFVFNFFVQHLLGVEKSNYLTQNIAKQSFLQTIIRFCGYIYTLVFANCVPDSFLKMLLVKLAPTQIHIFELMKNISHMATVFIIPSTILFFINVYKSSKKYIFSLFSSICMILCVVALPLLGGGMVALRSQYVLPFFVAFLFLYISSKTKNKWQTLCFILFMLVASRQTLICSMLNYSDVIRYNYDVRLSSEIASRIIQTGANKETPILLYGKSKFDFNNNFLKGEAIAHSSFAWDTQYNSEKYCTSRGIAFMKLHGFYFTEVNDTKLIEKAKEFAKNMQDFPHKESVCNLGDVVVVRLSESEY